MEIFLGNNFEITKSGLSEGFIRKKSKRLKNEITNIKQSKKGRNRMQKKIENAYEINKRNAVNFERSARKTENQIIKEKNNFAGITLTKQQRLFLERKGLEIFLDRYPQFA
jgi:hypothetical protein|nr:MAG TPA: hypothetical protein [Caudoviricetes sp.]